MWYSLVRNLLFRFDPEKTHHWALKAIRIFYAPICRRHSREKISAKSIAALNLKFPNRVGLAAGFDNNADSLDSLFGLGFGFIEVGGVTPKPQAGNPKPRLFRIPQASALINRMGFDNKGVDYVVEQLKKRKVPGIVGINIAKNKDTPLEKANEDYQYCIKKAYAYVDYITVNISSPNTPGLRELQTEAYLESLISDLKKTQNELSCQHNKKVPLLVKLSVDLSNQELAIIINILMRYEIEGVIAANTSTDHQAVSNYPNGNEVGGLSGRPVFQRSTEIIRQIHAMTNGRLLIIGLGGIFSAEDAKEKLDAGASLVQIYTGLIYKGPGLVRELIKSL